MVPGTSNNLILDLPIDKKVLCDPSHEISHNPLEFHEWYVSFIICQYFSIYMLYGS